MTFHALSISSTIFKIYHLLCKFTYFTFSLISLTMIFNPLCCILTKSHYKYLFLNIRHIKLHLSPQATKWLFCFPPQVLGIILLCNISWGWRPLLLPRLSATQILLYYFSLSTSGLPSQSSLAHCISSQSSNKLNLQSSFTWNVFPTNLIQSASVSMALFFQYSMSQIISWDLCSKWFLNTHPVTFLKGNDVPGIHSFHQ